LTTSNGCSARGNSSVYFDGLKIKKLQFFDANNFVKIKTFRIFAT